MFRKYLVFSLMAALGVISACSDSNTIAKVGDKNITEDEFQAYLKFKRIPQQDEKAVDRALDEYLRRAALAQAIEKKGTLDSALVEAELEEFRRELLIGRHFNRHLRDSVDERSVENYYANNVDEYRSESVHAAHILIRVDTRMTESERSAKRTQAHEIYSQLRADGDFEELAREHSQDKVSAEKGGDLGWLRKGAVDPEFSERLFALEEGEISEPFLTPFGFHIVQKIEGPQTVTRPLESVSGDIRYQLRHQAKQAETERLMESVEISRED